MKFSEYLSLKKVDAGLRVVLTDLALCSAEIWGALREGHEGYAGAENVYGDRQVKMDLIANEILVSRMDANAYVALIASEELETPLVSQCAGDGFSVCFDPLDGSSLVDANLTVGTIAGIYRGGKVEGKTGREQVAAFMALYGARLTFLIASGEGGVDEFFYDVSSGDFVLNKADLKIPESGKSFAPGNIAACAENESYGNLLRFWMENGYKLRYSGGMAPDVNQLIKKGGGVFLFPGSARNPEGKLRLLYECAPVAMIVERGEGMALETVNFMDVLDVKIRSADQTLPVIMGSKKNVEIAKKYLGGDNME